MHNDTHTKLPEEIANEVPLINSTPNPDYIESVDYVSTHTGNSLEDIINS